MIKLYPFACIKDRYYIIHNNVAKGIIDYVIDENDEVFIQMIKVYEEHRREGVGRQTMEYMKQLFPDKVIYGDSLPKSVEFWKALGVTFTGKPEYKTRRDDLVHFIM